MKNSEWFRKEKGLVLIINIYLSDEGPSYLYRIFRIGNHELVLIYEQAGFSDYIDAENSGLSYLNENYGE